MTGIMGDDGDHMGSWEMEKPEKPYERRDLEVGRL